jgi:hypothetical protein
LNNGSPFQVAQGLRRRNPFDLGPIFTFMRMTRVQQFLVEIWFVAEEQETFGIGVEAADGVDIFWELKFGERAIRRGVGCELGKDAIGFVECNKHRDILRLGPLAEHSDFWIQGGKSIVVVAVVVVYGTHETSFDTNSLQYYGKVRNIGIRRKRSATM